MSLSSLPVPAVAASARSRLWPWLAAALALAGAVDGLVAYGAFQAVRADLGETAAARARVYAGAVAGTVARYANVPLLLARDPDVRRGLEAEPRDGLDRRLAEAARATGADVLYLLDPTGLTVASSNWDQPDSFVGQTYAFRPYYRQAIAGRAAQYVALGTASRRLGYYLSYPVEADGRVAGVMVAKIDIVPLERGWQDAPEIVLVTDENGVVVLTNRPAWRYGTVGPLSEAAQARIRAEQRYPMPDLVPLPVQFGRDWARIANGPEAGRYLLARAPLPGGTGQLYTLVSIGPAWTRAGRAVLLTVLISGLAVAGLAVLLRRRDQVRRQRRREEEVRDLLERKVGERTAELEAANRRLRDAQGELVQAAKLAGLGQLSASLAHELSQPLAAIRSFAENGLVLLARGRAAEVSGNLGEIVSVTERMGRIAHHLKAFARRSADEARPVALQPAVERALALVEPRRRALRVAVEVEVAPDLTVAAGEVRLEQVLLNLLQNALDAVADAPRRAITVAAWPESGGVALSVRDSGPGIAPEVAPQLFASFVTTKPPGQGLGLGLSISRDIVEALGGRIAGASHPDGGADFTLWLPCPR